MRRRSGYIAVFIAIAGPLLLYNVVIPELTVTPTMCPAIFADLSVTTNSSPM